MTPRQIIEALLRLRANKSYVIAGTVAIAVFLWLAGSDVVIGGRSAGALTAAGENAAEAQRARVRVLASTAESVGREVVVRGKTAALRRVELRAEAPGRVVELPVGKGGRVKAGAPIARLATDDRLANLAQADAQMRQRQIEYDAAEALAEKGFRPKVKLAEARAQLDAARADVKRMQVEVEKLTIRAPFDSVLEELPAEIGAYLKAGDPVALVVDEDPFLVVAQVSERDIGALTAGQAGHVKLATGEQLSGRVRFMATASEATTRTFRVELEIPNRERRLREGITAELRLPAGATRAHKLTPAVLTLNEHGVIGIRAVEANGQVKFHAVDIVGEVSDGVWVAGLPEQLNIIVVGQEFVRDGQLVAPLPVN
jgi:membrane fusion protein, multidrug efflux system